MMARDMVCLKWTRYLVSAAIIAAAKDLLAQNGSAESRKRSAMVSPVEAVKQAEETRILFIMLFITECVSVMKIRQGTYNLEKKA